MVPVLKQNFGSSTGFPVIKASRSSQQAEAVQDGVSSREKEAVAVTYCARSRPSCLILSMRSESGSFQWGFV